MTVTITQTCDRCGATRDLNVGYRGGLDTIKQAALGGGWRDVQEFKHLCADCINAVLTKEAQES
jgi:hypothetical protein